MIITIDLHCNNNDCGNACTKGVTSPDNIAAELGRLLAIAKLAGWHQRPIANLWWCPRCAELAELAERLAHQQKTRDGATTAIAEDMGP